jgi:hypothetical protein
MFNAKIDYDDTAAAAVQSVGAMIEHIRELHLAGADHISLHITPAAADYLRGQVAELRHALAPSLKAKLALEAMLANLDAYVDAGYAHRDSDTEPMNEVEMAIRLFQAQHAEIEQLRAANEELVAWGASLTQQGG